jgi:hypothetical protein
MTELHSEYLRNQHILATYSRRFKMDYHGIEPGCMKKEKNFGGGDMGPFVQVNI